MIVCTAVYAAVTTVTTIIICTHITTIGTAIISVVMYYTVVGTECPIKGLDVEHTYQLLIDNDNG